MFICAYLSTPFGVNLSPEFVNLSFPYAGRGPGASSFVLFFRWWQRHFEWQPPRVSVERRTKIVSHALGRINVVLNQCSYGDGVCRLLVRQFFYIFARFNKKCFMKMKTGLFSIIIRLNELY